MRLWCMSTRRSVTLTDPQLLELQEEADSLGITLSDLIRRIVDEWRKHRKEGNRQ